ncbi:peptide chain release factor N(5)-glutamine methyltransferase [Streptococcus sp. S784/96/1]|uniref:peptide chain release factor N(5)-glutamine methyltransferase n=1 Tax=Streptococcus sp. S784/96/1 TaxID=2653499 RepID=UPI001386C4E9|nr:peptide chain release factor N(5)-glutamine methyltransferase [Streptococcus sp. S784/96/1]
MTYANLIAQLEERLEQLGEEREGLVYVFQALKGWTKTDLILHLRQAVTDTDEALFHRIFEQLSQQIPPQYITGKAYFGELELAVDDRVLIPRPETEELVDLILRENSGADCHVLDIGTGSGAIALSLKKARPAWQVTASDVSPEALSLARENAQANQLEVTFIQSDVFSAIEGSFDIIVSNPPYISYDDKDEVGGNVLASEPHLALFADEDGYAIYRQIIEQSAAYLTPKGKLYFEIGYKQGAGLTTLLNKVFPETRVRVLKDMFGKDRMVVLDGR